jgi:hypothetical protein
MKCRGTAQISDAENIRFPDEEKLLRSIMDVKDVFAATALQSIQITGVMESELI